jgi:hypothetical protein
MSGLSQKSEPSGTYQLGPLDCECGGSRVPGLPTSKRQPDGKQCRFAKLLCLTRQSAHR